MEPIAGPASTSRAHVLKDEAKHGRPRGAEGHLNANSLERATTERVADVQRAAALASSCGG